MELIIEQIADQVQVQQAFLRELADIELVLVGGGMGSVCFDDD